MSLTTLESAYTQDFNTLANIGTSNNLTINGWYERDGDSDALDSRRWADASMTDDQAAVRAEAHTGEDPGSLAPEGAL